MYKYLMLQASESVPARPAQHHLAAAPPAGARHDDDLRVLAAGAEEGPAAACSAPMTTTRRGRGHGTLCPAPVVVRSEKLPPRSACLAPSSSSSPSPRPWSAPASSLTAFTSASSSLLQTPLVPCVEAPLERLAHALAPPPAPGHGALRGRSSATSATGASTLSIPQCAKHTAAAGAGVHSRTPAASAALAPSRPPSCSPLIGSLTLGTLACVAFALTFARAALSLQLVPLTPKPLLELLVLRAHDCAAPLAFFSPLGAPLLLPPPLLQPSLVSQQSELPALLAPSLPRVGLVPSSQLLDPSQPMLNGVKPLPRVSPASGVLGGVTGPTVLLMVCEVSLAWVLRAAVMRPCSEGLQGLVGLRGVRGMLGRAGLAVVLRLGIRSSCAWCERSWSLLASRLRVLWRTSEAAEWEVLPLAEHIEAALWPVPRPKVIVVCSAESSERVEGEETCVLRLVLSVLVDIRFWLSSASSVRLTAGASFDWPNSGTWLNHCRFGRIASALGGGSRPAVNWVGTGGSA